MLTKDHLDFRELVAWYEKGKDQIRFSQDDPNKAHIRCFDGQRVVLDLKDDTFLMHQKLQALSSTN